MTDIGYGLRPNHPLEQVAQQRLPRRRRQAQGQPEWPHRRSPSTSSSQVRLRIHPGQGARALRRAQGQAGSAGQGLRRPQDQGGVLLDHGLQPAHPRHLGQQHDLQRASAGGQDLRAGQRPVLADRPAVRLRHRARGRHLRPPPAGRHGGDESEAPRDCREDSGSCPPAPFQTRSASTPWCRAAMLKDGKLNFYWTRTTNNMQAGPNINGEIYPGWRNPANFIVVSDAYPTVIGPGRRPDPALRHVGGKGRRLRQRRAPHPVLAPAGQGRRAKRGPTCGSTWSSPSASRSRRCGRRNCSPRSPEYKGKTLYDVLYANGQVNKFPLTADRRQRLSPTTNPKCTSASTCRRACSRNTPSSAAAMPMTWPTSTVPQGARPALAGGGQQGNPVALPRGL